MYLTLKRQPDTRPEDEFWYVIESKNEKLVGRIYRDAPGNLERNENWFWGLLHPFERGSDERHYGNAKSKDEAMAAFKARWLLSHPD